MKDAAKKVLPNGVQHEVRRFFYDTAQGHHDGAIAALTKLVPVSQVMFGTDFPYRVAGEVVDGLGARTFTAAERMAIDRGNALRIFKHCQRLARAAGPRGCPPRARPGSRRACAR